MLNQYRLSSAGTRPRGIRAFLRHFLSSTERAKRQLEKQYQRRALERLRESGLARA